MITANGIAGQDLLDKCKLQLVSIDSFKELVSNGQVASIKLKDDELLLKVFRKEKRRENDYSAELSLTDIYGDPNGGNAIYGLHTDTYILDGSSGGTMMFETTKEVEIAPDTKIKSNTNMNALAAVGATSLAAVTSVTFPIVGFVLASTAAIVTTTVAVTGSNTKHKIYDFTSLRLINSHVALADVEDNTVAICVAAIERKLKSVELTLFLYGKGVKQYILYLLKVFPELKKRVKVPVGNFTTLMVDNTIISDSRFYEGYKLLFNTQNLNNDIILNNISKKQHIPIANLNKLKENFDNITQSNLVTTNGSGISAYCKKMNITEEYFYANECDRLCSMLGCNKDTLNNKIALLL